MEALTVKQPWADLIVSGIKDIENRTWRTYYRGRVLIHSAKSVAPREELEAYPLPALKRSLGDTCECSAKYLTGAIIGSVEITDCVMNHPSEWAEEGVWNWVLSNPHKYDTPITDVRGMLSLWNYPLPVGSDFPYGLLEYLLSARSLNHHPDKFGMAMKEIESMDNSKYLRCLDKLLDASESVAEEISNSIQFFRGNDGESITTIRATPDKTFLYNAEEIEPLVCRLNKLNN